MVAFGLAAAMCGGIQALDGCFMAARREVLAEVPFDEQSFPGWHLYDVDFSLSAWPTGFGVAVCADLLVIHQSRGGYDAPWQHAGKCVRGEASRGAARGDRARAGAGAGGSWWKRSTSGGSSPSA